MTLGRIRVSATAAIAAMLLYGLAGHATHEMSTDDGMAGAVAGLCLLLVTVLGCAGTPRSGQDRELRPAVGLWVSNPRPAPPSIDRRARASPSTLQRFLN